jgi:hypothetical protein
MNMNINTLVTLITKLINKPAHDALVTQNKLMDNLTIEEWLPKIPNGTYNIPNIASITVTREDNHLTISSLDNKTDDSLPVYLTFDTEGLRHCAIEEEGFSCTFLRKGKYYKPSDEANDDVSNITKTKASVDNITALIRNIGTKFYHNEPIALI